MTTMKKECNSYWRAWSEVLQLAWSYSYSCNTSPDISALQQNSDYRSILASSHSLLFAANSRLFFVPAMRLLRLDSPLFFFGIQSSILKLLYYDVAAAVARKKMQTKTRRKSKRKNDKTFSFLLFSMRLFLSAEKPKENSRKKVVGKQ